MCGQYGRIADMAPRVGAYFDLRNPPPWRREPADVYAWALDWAERADRSGLGAIWLTEHHGFADGYLPQPLTMAAAVAARTRVVRVGTAVMIAPLRPAPDIAEQAAVVDLISGGRLELGLGAGYGAAEFELYGTDLSRRFEALERKASVVHSLWREKRVTPAPVQDPLPLWIGAGGPRGARLAGRAGAGLLHLGGRLLEPYMDGLRQGGHSASSARTGGVVDVILGDDPEATWAAIRAQVGYQQASYANHSAPDAGLSTALGNPRSTPRFAAERGKGLPAIEVMTPSAAVDHVLELIGDKPVSDVMFWASIAGMPQELADRHLELLCDQVAPALQETAELPAARDRSEMADKTDNSYP
jgi:alkanesulfonate monooxygenase SsuD/methylene tetrahydromethanopterin reductase-like flavin-dependent oxidoreductase (luciferase family)